MAGRRTGRRSFTALGLAIVLPAALIGQSGCGGSAPSGRTAAQQQAFLLAVHGAAPDISAYRSDIELTRLGRAVCDDLRSGASYQQVADRLGSTSGANSLPTADLGAVITSATTTYCPQYANRVS